MKNKYLNTAIILMIGLSLIRMYIYVTNDAYLRTTQISGSTAFDEEFAVDTPGCKIQNLDPYHWSIENFLINYSEMNLECTSLPMIVAVNRKLIINKKHPHMKNVNCLFQSIFRKSENDFGLSKPQFIDRVNGNVIKSEFVMAECFNASNIRIYQDFYVFISRKPEVEKRVANILKKKNKKKFINVLLVGLDSVPKTAYTRHLKLVDNFFRERLTFIELHGYNKLGYNTYPNMIALNTGKLEEEFDFDQKTTDLNVLPMMWKMFAKRGFRTLYGEDYADGATFNYLKKGFNKQPTDYYLRPFSQAVEYSNMKKQLVNGCYHNRTEASVIFKWVLDFFKEFPNDPLFAYVFLSNLSHDEYNGIALYDKDVFHFFEGLYKSGHLNSTIVFFFSDHGYRFEGVSSTYLGHLEEILPFSFVLLPSWFPEVYPRYYANMKVNERRLVTALDIHSTLVDVATDFQMVKYETDSLNRSVSLFTQIAETRNCRIANIKSQYCICFDRENVAVDTELVINGAYMLLDIINEMTEHLRDLCGLLEMKEIMEAKVRVDGKESENVTDYLITFQTLASDGIFQGTVLYDKMADTFTTEKIIDRLNRYGNQSACISDSHLRLYCYCV